MNRILFIFVLLLAGCGGKPADIVCPKPVANAGMAKALNWEPEVGAKRLHIGAPAVAGEKYSWSPATGLDDPSSSNPMLTMTAVGGKPPASAQYTVTAQNSCGSTSATVLVTVRSAE